MKLSTKMQPRLTDIEAITGLTLESSPGAAAMRAPVTAVRVLTAEQVLTDTAAANQESFDACLVLLQSHDDGREHQRDYLVDLALRVCSTRGGIALLVSKTERVSNAARELANRLDVPLLRLPDGEPSLALAEILALVRRPDQERAHAITNIAHSLDDDSSLAEILHDAAETLRGLVVVQDGMRLLQAGRPRSREGEWLPALFTPIPLRGSEIAHTVERDSQSTVVCPIPLPRTLQEHQLLLVAQRNGGDRFWRERALEMLVVVRHRVAALIMERHLAAERRRAVSSALLREIIDARGHVTPSTDERAESLGWSLPDWHLAIAIRVREGTIPTAVLDSLDVSFAEVGLAFPPLVPSGTGAVTWASAATIDKLPGHDELRSLLADLLVDSDIGAELIAGIGTSRRSTNGLVLSISDAVRASVVPNRDAADGDQIRSGAGRAVDRILALWFSDELLEQESKALIGQVLERPELRQTLEAFYAANGSVAETARRLDTHRNTITHRLARISKIIAADIEDPVDRLALGVALRITRQ